MQSVPAVVAARSLNSKLKSELHIPLLHNAVLTLIFSLFVSACTSSQRVEYEIVQDTTSTEQYEIQALSPEQQDLEEILKAPTEFTKSYPDAQYAWERAQIFFRQHTAGLKFSAGNGNQIILSNRQLTNAVHDPIVYSVAKRDISGGAEFVVNCQNMLPNFDEDKVQLSCRNLARFIRDGTLQTSLIMNPRTKTN